MKKKNTSVYQPEPSLDELVTWATPRLLRYYKAKRINLSRVWNDELDDESTAFMDRLDAIKAILNNREHVV